MKTPKLFIILIVLLTFSCDNDVNVEFPDYPNFPPTGTNCLRGQGNIVSEARTIADNFTAINSSIFADILITQGPKEDIRIEAQQNIINQINMDVVNGELRITQSRCVSIAEAIEVYITLPEIESIALTGVGKIILQNDLDVTSLEIVLSGTGDFILRGVADNLDVEFTGVGDIQAFELITDICNVNISGVGDAELFVNEELNVTITGTGNLYYKGNPAISSSITGTGSVIDAN